jgi:hypothetical protein
VRNMIAPMRTRPAATFSLTAVVIFIMLLGGGSARGQFLLSGRVWMPRFEGQTDLYPFTAALVFASPEGSTGQTAAFRTWETEPSGWYRLSGNAGRWTVLYAGPGSFMRPIVLTNQYFDHGLVLTHHVAPACDYAMLSSDGWDASRATYYYQTFVARSRSLTHVGFMLAHDGVDGEGPESQMLLASVHKQTSGTPDQWEQVGPTAFVPGVDCGGSKSLRYAAAWNSGEVPLEPGKTYAVRLRAEKPGNSFQCLWRQNAVEGADCYRVDAKDSAKGSGFSGRDMWMYIAGDSDGLLVPYNKRVQKEWAGLTRFSRKWSQTYVAGGRSLAGVMLYVAVAGSQPPLRDQQMWVRLRRGGPDGPIVGTSKIAVGQGTSTALTGLIGAAFAPGEVPLEPGQRYAVEWEAFGSHKGANPYRKSPLDPYEQGEAWFNGTDRVDYDLDMLVFEYEQAGESWADATAGANLISNGDMSAGTLDPAQPNAGGPDGWTRFAIDPATTSRYTQDENGGRHVTVLGGSGNGKTVDGGFVQRVSGLSKLETYRIAAKVRSSWAVDEVHQAFVGVDPTGQDTDPKSATIVWTVLPHVQGIFDPFVSRPIRPQGDAVSVWLRAKTTFTHHQPFVVDFDDVQLHRVDSGVPGPERAD